jgi:hypothetical protein
VYSSFGDDVGVETVAEIDRVDVVTGKRLACRPRKMACCSPMQRSDRDMRSDRC